MLSIVVYVLKLLISIGFICSISYSLVHDTSESIRCVRTLYYVLPLVRCFWIYCHTCGA